MRWKADPHRFRRLPGDEPGKMRKITEPASRSSRISTARGTCCRRSGRSKFSDCSAPTSRCSSTNASSFRPTPEVERAMRIVAALGRASKRAFERNSQWRRGPGQALFAIVQGGTDVALRARSRRSARRDGLSRLRHRRARGRRGHEAMIATLADAPRLPPISRAI